MMSKTDLFVKLSKLVIVKMIKINQNYVNLTKMNRIAYILANTRGKEEIQNVMPVCV